MWQAKGLRKSDFGSVAIAGLTGEILEVWQTKELGEIGSGGSWRGAVARYEMFRREWRLTIKVYVGTKVQCESR